MLLSGPNAAIGSAGHPLLLLEAPALLLLPPPPPFSDEVVAPIKSNAAASAIASLEAAIASVCRCTAKAIEAPTIAAFSRAAASTKSLANCHERSETARPPATNSAATHMPAIANVFAALQSTARLRDAPTSSAG